MGLLSRLFGKSDTSSEILCPRCERPMDAEHDAEACARRGMSRRFFFGILGGATVVAAMPALPAPDVWTVTIETGPSYEAGILTPRVIEQEVLYRLKSNLAFARDFQREYNRQLSTIIETVERSPRRDHRQRPTTAARIPHRCGMGRRRGTHRAELTISSKVSGFESHRCRWRTEVPPERTGGLTVPQPPMATRFMP
jgi:hypothetical protein